MSIKLEFNWSLWYDKTDIKISVNKWDQFLIKVHNFNTLEEFWCFFNNIHSLSGLPVGSNYHFFKTGIEPKWEDLENLEGGKWVFRCLKIHSCKIDKIWEKSIYMLVSGNFPKIGVDNVNGLVGSARKNEIKLALWTKTGSDRNQQILIGKYWKNIIKEEFLELNFTLEYFPHTLNRTNSRCKEYR